MGLRLQVGGWETARAEGPLAIPPGWGVSSRRWGFAWQAGLGGRRAEREDRSRYWPRLCSVCTESCREELL